MRIEKWGFLLSYAIYLVFCMGFSLISKDNDAINTMILSITIASTAFSLSDLLFTKIDIDKKERESLVRCCINIAKILLDSEYASDLGAIHNIEGMLNLAKQHIDKTDIPSGAKTVPRNHANKNRPYKTNEKMQILAIKSIENISKNAIHIA